MKLMRAKSEPPPIGGAAPVGSAEVLLHLISLSQRHSNGNGTRPTARRLWKAICQYAQDGGHFSFYRFSRYDPHSVDLRFDRDLSELEGRKFIETREKGTVAVSGLGRCVMRSSELPDSLYPLIEAISQAKTE